LRWTFYWSVLYTVSLGPRCLPSWVLGSKFQAIFVLRLWCDVVSAVCKRLMQMYLHSRFTAWLCIFNFAHFRTCNLLMGISTSVSVYFYGDLAFVCGHTVCCTYSFFAFCVFCLLTAVFCFLILVLCMTRWQYFELIAKCL